LLSLDKYLTVKPDDYKECLGELTHSLTCHGGDASLRFHYVLFDGDGEPQFEQLAEQLATFVVTYSFNAKKFQNSTPQKLARLFMQARDLFRKYEHSGQAGEVLIYFLVEAILLAPQVLQKMPITTNPADERKGTDGIHAKWNPVLHLLDVYFCESKIWQNFSDALADAFKSMEKFHETKMRKHEFFLTTHNLQLVDQEGQDALTDFFLGKPGTKIRTNHACLLGFNWNEYACLGDHRRSEFLANFVTRYELEARAIRDKIDKKFSKSQINNFHFDFFMVPFRNVDEFRTWFQKALRG
jgi:hypothetical protein